MGDIIILYWRSRLENSSCMFESRSQQTKVVKIGSGSSTFKRLATGVSVTVLTDEDHVNGCFMSR